MTKPRFSGDERTLLDEQGAMLTFGTQKKRLPSINMTEQTHAPFLPEGAVNWETSPGRPSYEEVTEWRWPFGRYAGERLENVPEWYLRWLKSQKWIWEFRWSSLRNRLGWYKKRKRRKKRRGKHSGHKEMSHSKIKSLISQRSSRDRTDEFLKIVNCERSEVLDCSRWKHLA